MAPLFSLPNELRLSTLLARFPCREQQIRSLASLVSIRGAPSRNIVLHGLEATGKSAITRAVLEELSTEPANDTPNGHTVLDALRYGIVKSAECIGGRHLLEQTAGVVAKSVGWKTNIGRCENLSQLVFEVGKLLGSWMRGEDGNRRFVLVFDGIDHQRDAPPTLLPALARLGEVIPNLTTIFIVTYPRPNFLHTPGVPHISFPAYTKSELVQIMSITTPTPPLPSGSKDAKETYSRFCSAVYDSLSKHSGRDILSFRQVCHRLWPRFIRPVLSGELSATPFSRLLVANRTLFQDENVLIPSIVSEPTKPIGALNKDLVKGNKYQGIGAQLPHYSRLLLVAAYLASFNPPRLDSTLFMKAALIKRRKKGGGTALTSRKPGVSKSRKISRKLLGPQAFVLERMLAIFHAINEESSDAKGRWNVSGSADIQMAIATLGSLRLLVRVGSVGGGDALDGGCRYRVAVGWEVVRGVARSVGVEVEDYLAD